MKKSILICLLFLLISIGIFVCSLWKYNNKKTFDKPLFDKNAMEGIPTVNSDLGYELLNPEGLYSVSLCGNPIIKDNKLKIYLTSSPENDIYIKARIYKNDKLVGESGLIKPNEYIEYINVKNIKSGDTINVKVMGYEKNSYYSAGVINIDLIVG